MVNSLKSLTKRQWLNFRAETFPVVMKYSAMCVDAEEPERSLPSARFQAAQAGPCTAPPPRPQMQTSFRTSQLFHHAPPQMSLVPPPRPRTFPPATHAFASFQEQQQHQMAHAHSRQAPVNYSQQQATLQAPLQQPPSTDISLSNISFTPSLLADINVCAIGALSTYSPINMSMNTPHNMSTVSITQPSESAPGSIPTPQLLTGSGHVLPDGSIQ